ncbi:MAG: metallophosphoesterase [Anaerolineaceae bacterium]|nr:metallophosphoesterase [Anaerolineaceae bacterium]
MQPLTFVHISDSHLATDPAWSGPLTDILPRPGAEALVREIAALPMPIDFVLHTGDVHSDPERPQDYRQAADLYRQLRMPVYFLPGNHDRSDWLQRELMGIHEPAAQADQEFEIGGVQFLLLDSSAPGVDEHYGWLEAEQLDWLAQRCAADDPRPLVVALHHNPLSLVVPWLDGIVLRNGEALHEALLPARARLRCVFYGHIHESILTLRDGIPYQSVRSSWFQTQTWHGQADPFKEPLHWPGYNLVTLTERDTFVRHCRVRL